MAPSDTGWHCYWPVTSAHDFVIHCAKRVRPIIVSALPSTAGFFTRLIHPKASTIPVLARAAHRPHEALSDPGGCF
jgi:hypothetical protein